MRLVAGGNGETKFAQASQMIRVVDLGRHAVGQGKTRAKRTRAPAVWGKQPFIQEIEDVIFATDDVQDFGAAPCGAHQGGFGSGAQLGPGQQDHAAYEAGGKLWQAGQGHAGTKAVGNDVDRACAKQGRCRISAARASPARPASRCARQMEPPASHPKAMQRPRSAVPAPYPMRRGQPCNRRCG